MRVETDEPHTIDSMELSQKQHSHRQQQMQEKQQEVERTYFQNVTNQTNTLLDQDNARFNEFAKKLLNKGGASTSAVPGEH